MGEPTIDEKRADARVMVYGDASPITEQEWHLARLVWALRGEATIIAHRDDGSWSCESGSFVVCEEDLRPSRALAVGARMARLVDVAAGHLAYYERETARLRALLAGAPDAAHGGPRG